MSKNESLLTNTTTDNAADAVLSEEGLRAKELEIFRRRVKVYNLKLMAANRGLVNKFTLNDIK